MKLIIGLSLTLLLTSAAFAQEFDVESKQLTCQQWAAQQRTKNPTANKVILLAAELEDVKTSPHTRQTIEVTPEGDIILSDGMTTEEALIMLIRVAFSKPPCDIIHLPMRVVHK